MASSSLALVQTSIPESDHIKYIGRGKVRDLYSIHPPDSEEEYLLFIATDRVSAYDVVLQNGIPSKGTLLTQISLFWFDKLRDIVPNHLVHPVPDEVRAVLAPYWKDQLEGRAMVVKKAEVIKLECIVRGYLSGSAWAEYKKTKTIHGVPASPNYVESSKLNEPLFTPSTKADAGQHDENLSPDQARALVGEEIYDRLKSVSLALYNSAHEYALTKGLILADTKFEFGMYRDPSSPTKEPQLMLIDEVLTPDSSRYWSAADYTPGRPQSSYDKQYLRDWLTNEAGFRKGLESGPEGKGWTMTEQVVRGTKERYEEAVELLVGSD